VPTGREVEVELGCADARWLFERASDRERFLVGVEIRRELVRQVNAQARERKLAGRLRAIYANLSTDLDRLFADGAVSRFVLNFPDPWFKRRHFKRRVLTPELAEILARKLVSGGELFFQSDVWDLALDAMDVLEASCRFENARGAWTFVKRNPYGAQSLREVRCLEREKPIWRLLYRTLRI
jgi:tRNA (guanine-N7-)-methyltransferase